MAILETSTVVSSQGLRKKIDAGAHEMILDNVQAAQYQYPIKSMVRELVSNALDSIREKKAAIAILSGKAKVEDHYVIRENKEAVFKDSDFNPDYYDLNHLSEEDKVKIVYREGLGDKPDTLEITDYGVGLGLRRMEGYFDIGFSTKRNNVESLGKFGLGSKSPHATMITSFQMESVHNGRKVRFEIYEYKFESTIPVFDLEGNENPTYQFETDENGYYIHYAPTNKKNQTTITVPCKKHKRNEVREAVINQFPYHEGLEFTWIDENGNSKRIETKADILYEDPYIVLPDNQVYTKPHILINGINYGYIDFHEMGIEQLMGNIGIKMQGGEIDINPSRETVRWTEKTTKAIKARFEKVVDIASKVVTEELDNTDFLKWLVACRNVRTIGANADSITARLARVIDTEKMKPEFKGDIQVTFESVEKTLPGFRMRLVKLAREKGKDVIRRSDIRTWHDFDLERIYLMGIKDQANHYKDLHLLKSGPFITIKPELEMEGAMTEGKKKLIADTLDKWKLMKASSLGTMYESIVLTDEQKESLKEKEEQEEKEWVDPAYKRELEQQTLVHHYIDSGMSSAKSMTEVKNEDIVNLPSDRNLFWGTANDHELLLVFRQMLNGDSSYDHRHTLSSNQDVWRGTNFLPALAKEKNRDRYAVIMVSQDNAKFFTRFPYIRYAFMNIKEGVLSVHPKVKEFLTQMVLYGLEQKYGNYSYWFMSRWEEFDGKVFEKYQKVSTFKDSRIHNFSSVTMHMDRELKQYFERLIELADMQQTEQCIREKSKEYFQVELERVDVVDWEIPTLYEEVRAYAHPLVELFSYFTIENGMPDEVKADLKMILRTKGYKV